MLSVLLGVHFVLTLAIIGLILLQKHDSDGALGSSGGGAASGIFTVRGEANILTKSTAVLMTIFIINCLVMAKITKNTPVKESVIDKVARESVISPQDSDNTASDGSAASKSDTTPKSERKEQPAQSGVPTGSRSPNKTKEGANGSPSGKK